MAAGSSYPADLIGGDGSTHFGGTIAFTDSTAQPVPSASGIAAPTAVAPTGLTGATQVTRYVGGVATVAPTTGTFAVGDFVIARNGHVFVCTTAGTPGTWTDAGSLGNVITSVFTRTGAVVATTGDYTVAQVTGAAPLASPTFTGTVAVPAAAAATSAPQLDQLTSALTIASGTLPNTGAWASGTAKQNPTTVTTPARQVTVNVEFVTDGTANAATCAIAISADNSTYTTIGTLTSSVGVNTAGAITLVAPVILPAAWWIKLTFARGSVAASIYY